MIYENPLTQIIEELLIGVGRIPGASEPGYATQNSYIFYASQKHSRAQVGVSWRKYWRKYGVSSFISFQREGVRRSEPKTTQTPEGN